jgi:hypothetical protein
MTQVLDAERTKGTGDHQGAKRRRWASVLTAWLGRISFTLKN